MWRMAWNLTADLGGLADAAPASSEVVRLERCADAGWEDEVVLLPVRPGVGAVVLWRSLCAFEGLDAQIWQRDGAFGVFGLGRDEAQFSADTL